MTRFLILALVAAMTIGAAQAETRVPSSSAEIALGFQPLVKQAAPAVVNIYARRVVEAQVSPFASDPFFADLFRGLGEVRPQVQNSLGSGVILTTDGLVVSNYHVVGQATDIRVVLNDRREFEARIVLGDQSADLAILKIEGASNLPALTLRDSDTVEVGELVLAIGNPFGVGQTVTSGIVSGLARSGGADGGGRGYFLQTDAAINPGNSGGALIDLNGALIGINTSILTRSGGSNGIGFAIPANLVSRFIEQSQAGHDRFTRPWAGMSGQSVDGDIAASLSLDRPGGILISDIHPASPFKEAGFQSGDVILSVGGFPVNTAQEMIFRMTVEGLNAEAEVEYLRDGAVLSAFVKLMAAPDTPVRNRVEVGPDVPLAGLSVPNINPSVLADFNLPLNSVGVVVEDPGPIGARLGLAAGDVLLAINEQELRDTSQIERTLARTTRSLAIEIQRGLKRMSLRVRL
ncbi:MAG TPA: serine protease [Rhodobacteraceae bacterium]|nr:serine protease [Paracoccaceae bacterium]